MAWNPLLLVMVVLPLQAPPAPVAKNPLPECALQALIEQERPAIEAREQRIADELAHPDPDLEGADSWAHEWAGRYYTGDGLGMNVMVCVAPHSGVTYTWHGCMGLYDANHGDIVEEYPDGLRVKLAIDPGASRYQFFSERLYFVRWGDRRYLVPQTKMLNLVNNYNGGSFTRASLFDIPLKFERREDIRVHHQAAPPPGRPELPDAYARLVLDQSVRFTITDVKTLPPRGVTRNVLVSESRVVIDGGRDRNVFVGMSINYREGLTFGMIAIESVGETTAEGTIRIFGSSPEQLKPPSPGTVLRLPGAASDVIPAPAPAPAPPS